MNFKQLHFKTRGIGLIVVMILIVTGCDSFDQKEDSLEPEFKIVTTSHAKGACKQETDPCFRISIEMPEATKGTMTFRSVFNEKVNSIILQTLSSFSQDSLPEQNIEMAIESLFDEFDTFVLSVESEDNIIISNWSIDMKGELLFESDEIVVLETNLYSYLGGAHPNQLTHFYNFDLASGEIYNLEDVFSDIPGLSHTAEVIFRNKYEISEESSLADQGFWIENNKFQLSQNFALTSTGVTFLYNAYEIGPYAMDIYEIAIPYEAIRDHLIVKPTLVD